MSEKAGDASARSIYRPPDPSAMDHQLPTSSDDMIELEHCIGFTGNFTETIIAHPVNNNEYVKAMGSVVSICDLSDPHRQEFLRAHDMEVSALAVSGGGGLIASSQLGTTYQPGYHAPVIVWDYDTRKDVYVLTGHTKRVRILEFSPDERFLAGTGDDCLLYIWDMTTGEVIFGKKFDEPVILFEWGNLELSKGGRRASYEVLLVSTGGGPQDDVQKCKLEYDPIRAQWSLLMDNVNMPSGGLARTYYSAMISADRQFMLCGTSVGDMLVFNMRNSVYRASVPVCSSGLVSLCVNNETGDVFCGGGDGTLKKLRGSDMRWELVSETMLDSRIVSLSVMANNLELLAGTDSGTQYRVLLEVSRQCHCQCVFCVGLELVGRTTITIFFFWGEKKADKKNLTLTIPSFRVLPYPKTLAGSLGHYNQY